MYFFIGSGGGTIEELIGWANDNQVSRKGDFWTCGERSFQSLHGLLVFTSKFCSRHFLRDNFVEFFSLERW